LRRRIELDGDDEPTFILTGRVTGGRRRLEATEGGEHGRNDA